MNDEHSCSYFCDRPKCIRAQRDELAARVLAELAYDRELIARMLDEQASYADCEIGAFSATALRDQAAFLRAADNADAAGVHTARLSQPAGGEAVALPHRPSERIKLILVEAIRAGVTHETQLELVWRAILDNTTPPAAQVQQEAVAWQTKRPSGWVDIPSAAVEGYRGRGEVIRPLYTHPAADALGAVRELVEKWRNTTGHDDFGCRELRARDMAVENCADALESALAQAPAENAAAKHWHDLYRKECLLRQDDAARYGQQIVDLEVQAPAVRMDDAIVEKAAKALSDRCADACSVSREDEWAYSADTHRADARAALEAALGQGDGP